ncbi:MAG: hypothetical protein IJW06_05525 [Clostridia bacterium]|nr:hypothetical protein [Clostridia bacterium]
MSDFNINENADVFNEEEVKQNIFVRVLKWLGVSVILLICVLLLYRCVTAKDHPVVSKVLMNEAFLEAFENEPDSVRVQQYGMQSAWVSVDDGRLIQFNHLYHIPVTNQLQFSIKYNHDIIDGEFEEIPFKLRLVDENGNVFDDYWFETASRERFRYIRVCFENIVLTKDEYDTNGKQMRHSYVLEIDAVQSDGSYEPLCKYEVYDGDNQRSDVFRNIEFKVE